MTAYSVVSLLPTLVMPDPEWPATPTPPISDGADDVTFSDDTENVRLMLRVKEGDVHAFERLVELHQNMVIGTACRMLGNVDDAHDIAQQVFLRVWKSAPRYEPTAKFTTWLFTILRNLVFNETRRRSRRKEVPLEHEDDDHAPLQFTDHTAPAADQLTQQDELESALDKAIASLPEKQRLAVVLRRHEELPYEEICEILKMSLPAVKSLLFRARTELRKHLAAYLGEDVA
ncbi:RNA polymerase sigma-70 factor (ECF subfamily) [Prosthecobacter fusiformis]|uniref:RNA polymerase sigma-70 factor (ECF subfamily) n=1 Tax=Prosthecobacter fusiformis TaxID=48464 RepID=A0A4R7RZ11_9BACT|nr:sigma-70 family RNA polymerase sigma factor [Prosthecobacter fusiformis]TDU70619.1 RNA polymerase sigma-70 factor (ECF subfamily) [Prosthecobacter fusiformis]